jgi:hypothetical protein
MKIILSTSKAFLALVMVMSFALTVLTVTSSTVFGVFSNAVEAVAGARTVRARHVATVSDLKTRNDEFGRRNSRLKADNKLLKGKLMDTGVTYRGAKRSVREAVKDTSTRVSRRVATASARNVGSMAGEAMPVIGVGVIVAATAWELHDACEMIKDLHELDVAFNPEDAIDAREVCGMQAPTNAELWQTIRQSPGDAWKRVRGLYDNLPDVSFTGTYERMIGLACRWFTCGEAEVMAQ